MNKIIEEVLNEYKKSTEKLNEIKEESKKLNLSIDSFEVEKSTLISNILFPLDNLNSVNNFEKNYIKETISNLIKQALTFEKIYKTPLLINQNIFKSVELNIIKSSKEEFSSENNIEILDYLKDFIEVLLYEENKNNTEIIYSYFINHFNYLTNKGYTSIYVNILCDLFLDVLDNNYQLNIEFLYYLNKLSDIEDFIRLKR